VGRFAVAGVGAVGARAARQIFSLGRVDELIVVGSGPGRADEIAAALGDPALAGSWDDALQSRPEAVVLAGPTDHLQRARAALAAGAHVVSVADGEAEVRGLLALDQDARQVGRSVVVGAGFSPGLSCLLALHAAAGLDRVEEIRVAVSGTAGPACAAQARASLSGEGLEWDGSDFVPLAAGSGRAQVWFPDPLGPLDCYRAAMVEPLLLQPAFAGVGRISARRAVVRAELLAARLGVRLPRRVRAEGLGGVRVEVSGRAGGAEETKVLGAVDRPAVAAGAVAGVLARWAAEGRLSGPGAAGVAVMAPDTVGFLTALADRGVRAAAYAGGV